MGSLFSKPDIPKPPPLPPPVRMPDPQDPAALEAKRRKQQEIAMRGGRVSTMLTDTIAGGSGGGKLGAGR